MSNYIIYCRKSSESEERQVLSIESQLKELNELTKRQQLKVSEVLTESQSAKYPGRPVFGRLMKKVSRGEVKGIISWKLDRLARNPMDGGALVWALDRGQIEEIITPYNTLRNNSNDKFLMQIEFGMAKKYVDDLSDNVRRGNRMKLEKGWLPGLAPIGYLNEPKERTIVPDPDRFALVRKMWDYLLQGVSPIKIHRIANEEWGLHGAVCKGRVGAPMNLSNVYKIFLNPFYYGIIERKEGVFRGKHEPMITEKEYWRAQELLGRKGQPRPKTHRFSFTGLIRCGECGGAITAEEKTNRYGSHYTYYHCTKKIRAVKCNQKTIRAEALERQLLEYLDKIHVPEKLLDFTLAELKERQKVSAQQEADRKVPLRKACSDCERRLDNLNQMRLRDLIGDDEYTKEKRKLLDEKLRLEQSIDNLERNLGRDVELTAQTFVFANQAKERFQKGGPDEKKTILRGIGSNFSLRDKKLTIQADKPFSIVENGLPRVLGQNDRLEPANNNTNRRDLALASPDILLWWALVEDVRTFYEEAGRTGTFAGLDSTDTLMD